MGVLPKRSDNYNQNKPLENWKYETTVEQPEKEQGTNYGCHGAAGPLKKRLVATFGDTAEYISMTDGIRENDGWKIRWDCWKEKLPTENW